MSVVRRTTKDGRTRFHARVHLGAGKYVNGQVRDTEREAKIDEGRLLEQPRRRRHDETVDAICDWFKSVYPERPRSRTGAKPRSSTIAAATRAIAPFRKSFGSLRPSDIPRDDLKSWVASHAWAVPWTKAMLNDAIDSELIDRNVLAGIPVRHSGGRHKHAHEFLTLDEVNALAACADELHGPTFAAFLTWLSYTCMRPGETFVLRHADIQGDEILVGRNLGGTGEVTTPKNHQTRRIILPKPAREAVARMPRPLHTDLVFTSKLGKRLSEGIMLDYWRPVKAAFLKTLEPERKAALAELVPYSLRHFGATYMLDVLGLDAFTVSIQMGHTDGGRLVQQTYGHRSHEAARERLRRAFNPAPVSELRSVETEAENV